MLSRTIKVLSIGLILAFSMPAFSASQAPPPYAPQPESLVPTDASAVMRISSIDDMIRLWADLKNVSSEQQSAADDDVLFFLDDVFSPVAEAASRTSPLLLCLRMPPVMMQQEPFTTAIFPLAPGIVDVGNLAGMNEVAAWAHDFGCLALSTDPTYKPSPTPTPLLSGMLPGTISACLDFRSLIEANREVVEMGLDSARMMAAMADSTQPQTMSPEQVDASVDLARMVIDSLTRVDLAFGVDGDDLSLQSRFVVEADSPLDLGPQPDFAEALTLTRLLPRDAGFIMASAFDQSRALDQIQDISVFSLHGSMTEMSEEQQAAYDRWNQHSLDIMAAANLPYASCVAGDDVLSIQTVIKTDNAMAQLGSLGGLLAEYGSLGLGLTFDPLPASTIDGIDILGWRASLDQDMIQEDPSNHDMQQLNHILETLCNEIHAAAHHGHLFISCDRGTDGLAAMLRALPQKSLFIDPRLASLAAEAGPECRQAVTGDIRVLLNWMSKATGESCVPGSEPILLEAVMTSDGPVGGFDLKMNLDGLKNILASAKLMEKQGGCGGH